MDAVKQITVNGRKYAVKMFSPLEAFEYIHDYTHARANGLNRKAMGMRAINQCSNEMGRELSKPDVFESHFSQYPEDMMPLEIAAEDELIGPFSLKDENTKANAQP